MALLLRVCTAMAYSPPISPTILANDSGYIVLAQWDGRTYPDVQWALDVSRVATHFAFKNELKLQKLLPTSDGTAPSPTLTAYDDASRTFFTIVSHNLTAAKLWTSVINKNVSAITPVNDVLVAYPQLGATMVGVKTVTISDHLHVLFIFHDGTLLDVNPMTGATKPFCNLVGARNDTTVTTAIELDVASNTLHAVLEIASPSYANPRVLVAVDLHSRTVGPHIPIKPPFFHNTDPSKSAPFQMVWLESLNNLLIFHKGSFDQIIFTDPKTGDSKYFVSNLAEYLGASGGNLQFVADEFLQAVDTRQNVVIDFEKALIYFQCSDVDPDSGFFTTSLCVTKLPTKATLTNYVNIAREPMSYGYGGMHFVKVV